MWMTILLWAAYIYIITLKGANQEEITKCYFHSEDKYMEIDNTWPLQITVSMNSLNIYIVDIDLIKWRKRLSVIMHDKDKNKTIKEIHVERAVVNTVAVDYNIHSHRIYIGCDNGLKVYEELTGRIRDIPGVTRHISHLFLPRFKKDIFAVIGTEKSVYKFEYVDEVGQNLHVPVLKGTGGKFVLDLDNNVYYINRPSMRSYDTFTYVQLNGAGKSMQYDLEFKILAVDKVGRVFGIYKKSIYRLLSDRKTPQLVTTLDEAPMIMCFDRFNDIVIGGNEIFILKYDFKCYSLAQTAEQSAKCYVKQMIDETIKGAVQIAASHKTGTLYIATVHAIDEIYMIERDTNIVTRFNLISERRALTSSIAIDQLSGKLYIGTNVGVEIYDEISAESQTVSRFNEPILQIFVQSTTSVVYIQTEKDANIYKYESLDEGALQLMGENLNISMPSKSFVMDYEYNYYIQRASETQVRLPDRIKQLKYPDLKLAVDSRGKIYATANNSLYAFDEHDKSPHFIALIGFNFLCMCFDVDNNILFATPQGLISYTIITDYVNC